MRSPGTTVFTSVVRMSEAELHHPDVVRACQEKMAAFCRDRCARTGYELISVRWRLEQPPTTDEICVTGWGAVRLEATVRPIWTGVFGDLRRALAEDGLLPRHDLPVPPEALRSWAGVMIHSGLNPPEQPSIGDTWADVVGPVTQMRVWDGENWQTVGFGVDPAERPSGPPIPPF